VLSVPFVLLGGHAVSALFFGVTPYDWTILSAAAVTLFAVGACCSLLPAIRASRVDPMVALRQE
jgi:putative ABC transport system permease protein